MKHHGEELLECLTLAGTQLEDGTRDRNVTGHQNQNQFENDRCHDHVKHQTQSGDPKVTITKCILGEVMEVQSWNQPERRPGRHQSSTVVEEETIEGMVSPEDHRSQESEGRR